MPLLLGSIACAVHLPNLAGPFDTTLEGTNGSLFEGPIQRFYERLGFWNLMGRPVFSAVPTTPPILELYLNHPPLLYWLVRISVAMFGLTEWAFRLVPFTATVATVVMSAWWLRRMIGCVAGSSA